MGTDIHVMVLYRSKLATSYWDSFNSKSICLPRFYKYFSNLAGVRPTNGTNPNPPSPKGLPYDVDGCVLEEMEKFHSCSWATPEEWRQVIGAVPETLSTIDWHHIGYMLEEYKRWGYEAIVVYGFDS